MPADAGPILWGALVTLAVGIAVIIVLAWDLWRRG